MIAAQERQNAARRHLGRPMTLGCAVILGGATTLGRVMILGSRMSR